MIRTSPANYSRDLSESCAHQQRNLLKRVDILQKPQHKQEEPIPTEPQASGQPQAVSARESPQADTPHQDI